MATAVNPQTGERIQFDEASQQWIPVEQPQPIEQAVKPQETPPQPAQQEEPFGIRLPFTTPALDLPDFITGAGQETRATQELPELGAGGLLSQEDPLKIAAVTPVLLTTTNPRELGNILSSQFENVRITEDEKGNLIANNNATGSQVVINQPGVSQLDILQGLGIAATFSPAAKLATAGTKGAALTAGVVARRAAQAGVGAGLTEAGMQQAQEATGGEFNKEDVALASALGIVAEGGLGLIQRNTALKKKIADKLIAGDTDKSLAKFMMTGAGKVKTDKAAKEAINQGFDSGVVAAVKGAGRADKDKLIKMSKIMQKGKENSLFAMKNRPSDIAGDSLLKRVSFIKRINSDAGKRIDIAAKSLKGQQVDSAPAIDKFKSSLSDMGIEIGGDLRPIFRGSDVEGLAAPEAAIKNIVRRLSSGKRGVQPDAFELHRMKRYIDEVVTYGKAGEGLTGKTERILKELRVNLDDVLDSNFPVYNKANTEYADTIRAINSLQDVAGKKMKLFALSGDKAVGTLLRRMMGNAQSRVNLIDSVDLIESTTKKYGGKFKDDISIQMLFADELDTVFKPVARTSLAGETGKAVKRGVEASRGGAFSAGADILSKGADVARGINEANAFKSIESLLRR